MGLRQCCQARLDGAHRPGTDLSLVAAFDQQPINRERQQVLRTVRGGRAWRNLWRWKTGQMFQVIDNELNDHGRARWCGDRRPIAQRMPGAPVLQRSLIGTRGIARRVFMEEGCDCAFGFLGQALDVFQVGWRLAEQRRESEPGSRTAASVRYHHCIPRIAVGRQVVASGLDAVHAQQIRQEVGVFLKCHASLGSGRHALLQKAA